MSKSLVILANYHQLQEDVLRQQLHSHYTQLKNLTNQLNKAEEELYTNYLIFTENINLLAQSNTFSTYQKQQQQLQLSLQNEQKKINNSIDNITILIRQHQTYSKQIAKIQEQRQQQTNLYNQLQHNIIIQDLIQMAIVNKKK